MSLINARVGASKPVGPQKTRGRSARHLSCTGLVRGSRGRTSLDGRPVTGRPPSRSRLRNSCQHAVCSGGGSAGRILNLDAGWRMRLKVCFDQADTVEGNAALGGTRVPYEEPPAGKIGPADGFLGEADPTMSACRRVKVTHSSPMSGRTPLVSTATEVARGNGDTCVAQHQGHPAR